MEVVKRRKEKKRTVWGVEGGEEDGATGREGWSSRHTEENEKL